MAAAAAATSIIQLLQNEDEFMTSETHRTGHVNSGDVTLFYRHFGSPGGTPAIILHGANYYDSADWIGIAAALADDREIVVRDGRGFGQSTRSASKSYDHEANSRDIEAILDHLGWDRAVIMGHSMGGGQAIVFASRFADRAAGLVIVDHCPGQVGGKGPSVDNAPVIFPTIDAARDAMSRYKDKSEDARLEEILQPVEGGFIFRSRDPDFGNPVPLGDPSGPRMEVSDTWDELAAVHAPILLFRAINSNRYSAESLERVKIEFPRIELVELETGHDVPGAAPGALAEATSEFLDRIDAHHMIA
jgi:pimeloyl-ACP methyl ester carboxylesterase